MVESIKLLENLLNQRTYIRKDAMKIFEKLEPIFDKLTKILDNYDDYSYDSGKKTMTTLRYERLKSMKEEKIKSLFADRTLFRTQGNF